MSSKSKSQQIRKVKSIKFSGHDEQIDLHLVDGSEGEQDEEEAHYKSVKSRRATQHLDALRASGRASRHGRDELPPLPKPACKGSAKDRTPVKKYSTSELQPKPDSTHKHAKHATPSKDHQREGNGEEDGDDHSQTDEDIEEKKANFGSKLLRGMRKGTRKNTAHDKPAESGAKTEDPMFAAANSMMSAPSLTEAFAPVFVDATSLFLPSRTYSSHKDKNFQQSMAKLPTGKSGFAAIVESAFGSKVVESRRKEKPRKTGRHKKVKDRKASGDDEDSEHDEVDEEEEDPLEIFSDATVANLRMLADRARARVKQRQQYAAARSASGRGHSGARREAALEGAHGQAQEGPVRRATRQHTLKVEGSARSSSEDNGRNVGGSGRGCRPSMDHVRRSEDHERQQHSGVNAGGTAFKMEVRNPNQAETVYVERDEVNDKAATRDGEGRYRRSHHHHHHHTNSGGSGEHHHHHRHHTHHHSHSRSQDAAGDGQDRPPRRSGDRERQPSRHLEEHERRPSVSVRRA